MRLSSLVWLAATPLLIACGADSEAPGDDGASVPEIDRKPAPYANRFKVSGTEALQVELTLLEADFAVGKHEVRAVDRTTKKVLFSSEIELVK